MKKQLCVALIALGLGLTGAEASEPSFQLIAHHNVAGMSVPRNVVADIFLRKVQRWGDGQSIDPIDQSATSEVRESFSQTVLGMPVAGVRIYWMDKVNKGMWPPSTKQTDADVIDYVASHPGGIGYVAADTPVPPSVKVLKVL